MKRYLSIDENNLQRKILAKGEIILDKVIEVFGAAKISDMYMWNYKKNVIELMKAGTEVNVLTEEKIKMEN